MKNLKNILALAVFVGGFALSSCNKGPSCPAYQSLHTDKTYAYTPSDPNKDPKNNKKEVEKKKREQLKPKKYKKPYSLFPGGVR